MLSFGNKTNWVSMTRTLPVAPPGPAPDDDSTVLGHCKTFNMFFIVQLSVVVIVTILMIVAGCLRRRGPRKGVIDYGYPWVLLQLFWNVAFYGIAPICFFFIFWHDVLPHSFPMVKNMACVAQGSFPVIPVFFAILGVVFVVAYRPKPSVVTFGIVATAAIRANIKTLDGKSNNSEQEHEEEKSSLGDVRKALMMSSSVRGMFYVGTVQELLKQGQKHVMLTLADLSGATPFCQCSAEAVDEQNTEGGDVKVADRVSFFTPGAERPDDDYRGARHNPETASSVNMDHTTNARSGETEPLVRSPQQDQLYDSPTGYNQSVPFAFPAASESFDTAIIPPNFLLMPPFGGLMGSPAVTMKRTRGMLVELYRVLKPGAIVTVIDSAKSCFCLLQDLKAAGFNVIDPPAERGGEGGVGKVLGEHNKYAPFVFASYRLFELRAQKPVQQNDADVTASCAILIRQANETLENDQESIQNALLQSFAAPVMTDKTTNENEEEENNAASKNDKKKSNNKKGGTMLAPTQILIVVMMYQLFMFCLLSFIAAVCYDPLSIPKSIVIGQRLGNLLPQLALMYPMMAYFSRNYLVTSAHFYGFGQLMVTTIISDLVSIAASLVLSALFFLPTFGIQIALNSTSLSVDTKSYIGLAVSLVLGFASTRYHMWRGNKKKMQLYNIDEDMLARVEKSAK